ncbi:MAG: sugar phosphate isomerase/epimerase [Clostridia bacterium]|nr:sugar phosphate isomerase/epimerase [Clostridia bacterium]
MSGREARLSCSVLNFVHRRLSDSDLIITSQRAMEVIKEAGFPGVEVYIRSSSTEALVPLKKKARELGLAIRSVHFLKPIMNMDYPRCCQVLRHSIQRAAELEASLGVLHLPRLLRYQEALVKCNRVIDTVLKEAEINGIILTIENQGHHRCHLGLEQLMKSFRSSWLGITLDLKFLQASGVNFEDFSARLGDYLENVHINDYDGQLVDLTGRRHYPRLGQGNINLSYIGNILKDLGYTGLFTLESSLSGSIDELAELKKAKILIGKYFI